jgi:hypothetical protein
VASSSATPAYASMAIVVVLTNTEFLHLRPFEYGCSYCIAECFSNTIYLLPYPVNEIKLPPAHESKSSGCPQYDFMDVNPMQREKEEITEVGDYNTNITMVVQSAPRPLTVRMSLPRLHLAEQSLLQWYIGSPEYSSAARQSGHQLHRQRLSLGSESRCRGAEKSR